MATSQDVNAQMAMEKEYKTSYGVGGAGNMRRKSEATDAKRMIEQMQEAARVKSNTISEEPTSPTEEGAQRRRSSIIDTLSGLMKTKSRGQ